MSEVETDERETSDVGGLDGLHHYWCKKCHPDWAKRPLGAPLGAPFIAWCGTPAVILVRWQSDDAPVGVCPKCADPSRHCPACGHS